MIVGIGSGPHVTIMHVPLVVHMVGSGSCVTESGNLDYFFF